MFWPDIYAILKGNLSKFVYQFVWTLPKLIAIRRIVRHSPNIAHDEILVHFGRIKLHYDEQGFLPAEMSALFLDYRALCRIVEIDCTFAELRAIFLKIDRKKV